MSSFFGDYAGLGRETGDLSDSGSSSGSEDSAEDEEEQVEAGTADDHSAPQSALPSFDDVFQTVGGPPSFLDPEATRPVAENFSHQRAAVLHSRTQATEGDEATGSGTASGGKAGVIQGKAKIYSKQEQAAAQQQQQERNGGSDAPSYSAAAIALMGGNVDKADGGRGEGAGDKRKAPSAAMAVQDFLEKGVGGAALPRKRQDRKDKEKSKRQMGQSSIGSWKTEAEMVLRQQYD